MYPEIPAAAAHSDSTSPVSSPESQSVLRLNNSALRPSTFHPEFATTLHDPTRQSPADHSKETTAKLQHSPAPERDTHQTQAPSSASAKPLQVLPHVRSHTEAYPRQGHESRAP